MSFLRKQESRSFSSWLDSRLHGNDRIELKMTIDSLIQLPLKDLQSEAFRIRKNRFGNELTFSIPGTVSYHDDTHPFQKDRFAAISVTGGHCDLRCAHCKGKLLESMIPAADLETFSDAVDQLRLKGAHGILVSGGANFEWRGSPGKIHPID